MRDFRKRLKKGIIIFDGAIGTLLQARGLKSGRPPEEALVDDYHLVVDLQRKYAEAGTDVITTNSFGLSPLKIKEFGFSKSFEKMNILAAKAAREAAGEDKFVAGDLGPTGLFVEPVGDLPFGDALKCFADQARVLDAGGVDLFILETFADIKEIKAAVIGVREVSDKPIVATMTFDESARTTLGTPPEVAAVVLDGLGVDVIGSNCSVGANAIAGFLKTMRDYTSRPLIAQANAGMPMLKNGVTSFPDTPGQMAKWAAKFVALGCGAIGTCCGSTPKHTAAIKAELERLGAKYKNTPDPLNGATALASRTTVTVIGSGQPCAMVGERINPSRKKEFSDEIRKSDVSRVRTEARLQEAKGADVLDINVGVPGIDEPSVMKDAVMAANSASILPIAIDSTHHEAIEAALMACDGKPLINSINGEKKNLKILLPLAKKYGAAILGLCTDDKGVPKTAKDRLAIARKIIQAAAKAGISEKEILLDPVTVPVSAEPDQPNETIEAVRLFTNELGRGTMQGVSNVSFGLPKRPAINAAHMAMAMGAGLSAAFANPLDERVAEIFHASRVLLAQDKSAAKYIHYAASSSGAEPQKADGKKDGKKSEASDWKERLQQAVIVGEASAVESEVRALLINGENPLKISSSGLVPGIQEVGRRFESKELFLPNLLLSAEAMERGTALIRKALEKSSKKVKVRGIVVLATVEGDIHDIGKNIVATMLRTHGWNVIDLGRGVPAARVIKEARNARADVIALSALMTTTVVHMPEVIELARRASIPVMVGGAVLTDDYAVEIGADFYGPDAMAAVRGAEKLKTGKK